MQKIGNSININLFRFLKHRIDIYKFRVLHTTDMMYDFLSFVKCVSHNKVVILVNLLLRMTITITIGLSILLSKNFKM